MIGRPLAEMGRREEEAAAVLADVSPRELPFQVGSVMIVNLGEVVLEVSGRASSSSSYVLPVGFVSRRGDAS